MDPNVQVAIATVVGTFITTIGVIAVALITSRRGSNEKPEPEEDEKKDSPEVLELVQSLVMKNARNEATIMRLRAQVEKLQKEKDGT